MKNSALYICKYVHIYIVMPIISLYTKCKNFPPIFENGVTNDMFKKNKWWMLKGMTSK